MDIAKLETGDIILFGGSHGLMSRLIRYFDDAEYTHIGIIYKIEDIPFVLDMWKYGIELVPLSKRTAIYPKQLVLRRKIGEDSALEKSLFDSVKKHYLKHIISDWYDCIHIKYDYFLLLRIAIVKKLKIDFLGIGSKKRHICSELVQLYTDFFSSDYKDIKLITPQDFIRYKKNDFYIVD